jgi:ComF family protein
MPSDCRLCGGAMTSLGRVRVCEDCIARSAAQTAQQDGTFCSRCGDAMGFESARMRTAIGVSECPMCRLAPPEFERAVAAGDYDNERRELLHLLKFEGRRAVAEVLLGEQMATVILPLRGAAAQELLVLPVPLFAARERERGFNQALLLAKAAVRRLRKMQPEWKLTLKTGVLLRVKDTRSLYRLTRRQRRASLRGAFRVAKPATVRGREVLLIDDILTTGATARECARVLLRAGARKVWVATAARAISQGAAAAFRETDVVTWDASATPTELKEPDVSRQKSF